MPSQRSESQHIYKETPAEAANGGVLKSCS